MSTAINTFFRHRQGRTRLLLFAALISLGAGSPAVAEEVAPHQQSAAEIGKKLSNPLSNVWALFTEFDYNWSEGDASDGKWRSGQDAIFQPVMPIPLTSTSKLITRPTLPIIFSTDKPNGVRADGQGATFKTKSGLGDLQLPLLYARNPKPGQKMSFGVGPTFQFPTHSSGLGTDTWEAGPALVAIYKTPKVTAGALGQYWWNYAEKGSDVDDTSHGSLLYFFYYELPAAWQVGFNPTITYNDKADGDNKWNVPVGITVAHTRKFGKLPIKFQLGVEKSFIRQEDLGQDWQIKLNIIPVISGLIQKPLFGD